VENTFVKSKDKVTPITEKDLEKKAERSPVMKRPEDITIKNLEDEDFQLYMGLQILKSWEALRGKAS
ncbi:MAG TPA: hypothetical protein PK470_07825, partial [Candidatus Omnitrophota bacterium]|nr:hypothetical protein [Candidatus Omnitrophota bacterium]